MKAIIFDIEEEPIILDENHMNEGIWYDYIIQETTTEVWETSKWANAMSSDGSMWVVM